MASKKQCQGHFLYFNLSIETSSLFVLDSLNDSFSNSAFFSEPVCKSFFNHIVRCVTYQKDKDFSARRGLKSLAYKKNHFTQQALECGPLSCANLLMSLNNTPEFLTSYTIKNYNTSLSNLKRIFQHLLNEGTVPNNKIITN